MTVLSSFKVFGQISFLVVIAVIAIVGVWFLLNKTVFGKNIYIVGGNPEAAKVSGINVSKVIITVFIIESMFVGLAGILKWPGPEAPTRPMETHMNLMPYPPVWWEAYL